MQFVVMIRPGGLVCKEKAGGAVWGSRRVDGAGIMGTCLTKHGFMGDAWNGEL